VDARECAAKGEGKGRWSMNSSLLKNRLFQKKIEEEWKEWIKHINHYTDL
jgi:hypothetical protein